jgi:TonB family protein
MDGSLILKIKVTAIEKIADLSSVNPPPNAVPIAGRCLREGKSYTPVEYPQGAKMANEMGVVVLDISIDQAGKVANAKVLSGTPMLADAVQNELKFWKFPAAVCNRKPVAQQEVIHVNFSMFPNVTER